MESFKNASTVAVRYLNDIDILVQYIMTGNLKKATTDVG
jgi:hypothetical protein